jgi:hypothetical protein
MHGDGRALPLHPNQPVAANVPQTRAQIETPRIGMVEKPRVRGKSLAAAHARTVMRAGAISACPGWHPVMEFVDRTHRVARAVSIGIMARRRGA